MEINISGLQDSIQKLLRDYGEEAEEAVEEVAKKVAKDAKKELKATSPRGDGAGMHYADGWQYRVEKSRVGTNMTVYNSKKPGLTHLLENGHVTRNGTSRTFPDTPAYPHIARVNEKAQHDFIDGVESKLGF